jgi:hypothetical protein
MRRCIWWQLAMRCLAQQLHGMTSGCGWMQQYDRRLMLVHGVPVSFRRTGRGPTGWSSAPRRRGCRSGSWASAAWAAASATHMGEARSAERSVAVIQERRHRKPVAVGMPCIRCFVKRSRRDHAERKEGRQAAFALQGRDALRQQRWRGVPRRLPARQQRTPWLKLWW